MSDTPLVILGLPPEGTTLREIKAAYAKLLKLHRPDQDPAGFKRLRAAYEQALASCELHPGASVPSPGVPSAAPGAHHSQPPSPVLLPLPAGVEAAVAALRDAVNTRTRQRIRDAWAKLDAEAATLELMERFRLALTAFSISQTSLMWEVCSDERLLAHMREGDEQLPQLALQGWTEQRDVRRIREFVVSLNRARHLHGLPAWAITAVHAAIALAAWEPDTAEHLAQKAYPSLPPAARAELMHRSDQEVALGRFVAPLPENEKVFWMRCLRGKAPAESWAGPEARKLLSSLLSLCGPKWAGFPVLAAVLPPEQWQSLAAALNRLLH